MPALFSFPFSASLADPGAEIYGQRQEDKYACEDKAGHKRTCSLSQCDEACGDQKAQSGQTKQGDETIGDGRRLGSSGYALGLKAKQRRERRERRLS